MFGNCATGRLTIVTPPTITVRMAMTIATMGRLMKKLDMDLDSFQSNYENSPLAPFGEGGAGLCRSSQATRSPLLACRRSWPSFGHEWLGPHDHAREESLLPLRDHTFTGLQSVLDNPHGADAVTNLDRADSDLADLPDNVNLIVALQLCDSRLRDQ